MKVLVDYRHPCDKEILSRYGTIEYESKNMTIVVLDTKETLETIQGIHGVRLAREERCGILL